MLKLEELKPVVLERLSRLDKDKLEQYAHDLYESNDYQNYTVRLANDVKYFCFRSSELCDWYNKYDCHDTNITSLFTSALREYVRDNNLKIYL